MDDWSSSIAYGGPAGGVTTFSFSPSLPDPFASLPFSTLVELPLAFSTFSETTASMVRSATRWSRSEEVGFG